MNRAHTFALFALALAATPLPAATVNVSSLESLAAAIANATPGDRIVLADGKYTATTPIVINKTGTPDKPIVIESQSVGGAEITGDAGFRLAAPAAYVVIKGFLFTHRAGTAEIEAGAHHCRVTRNFFALKLDRDQRGTFLTVNGDDNEIDHNTFRDKDTEGQMLFVQGPGTTMCKRNWIHHNHFLDFRRSGKNNASGLHIGSSHRSMDSGFSVVEHNLFVNNVGENEGAICNKSCDNIYRFNTIVDSTELSLRHGHRCQVYGNLMINSAGIRFFGHDHRIHGNYFTQCRPAIAIGNGGATIPPGPLTSHERPDRVHVTHNVLVDNRANVQMSPRTNGLGSDELVFSHNIIQGGTRAVTIQGPLKNPTLQNNIIWPTDTNPGDLPPTGFQSTDPKLAKDAHGIHRPAPDSPITDNAPFTYGRPLTPNDVGPNAPSDDDRPLISAPRDVQFLK